MWLLMWRSACLPREISGEGWFPGALLHVLCLPKVIVKPFQHLIWEAWNPPCFTWSEACMLFLPDHTNFWCFPNSHFIDKHPFFHSLVRVWWRDECETRKNDALGIIASNRSPNFIATRFSGKLFNRSALIFCSVYKFLSWEIHDPSTL